jgi:hypothetical protein
VPWRLDSFRLTAAQQLQHRLDGQLARLPSEPVAQHAPHGRPPH